jgi:hypothetical protein
MYKIVRNPKLDFTGKSYKDSVPNLHKYPATMIPQLGMELLKEFPTNKGTLLDPYCGSGSSFVAALKNNYSIIDGYDLNPFATLISKVKFTLLDVDKLQQVKMDFIKRLHDKQKYLKTYPLHEFPHIHFWFSVDVISKLSLLKMCVNEIEDINYRNVFSLALAETVRNSSFTRQNEFKMYRIKSDKITSYAPVPFKIFEKSINEIITTYLSQYRYLLKQATVNIENKAFTPKENYYDCVLTSPPYGDSQTTVAYGQFSFFANEWLGIENARGIDKVLMGGKKTTTLYDKGIIGKDIEKINDVNPKRALEVSSFYEDLEQSIVDVAKSVKQGGKIFYVVGNRRVCDIQLQTDQFIAETFCNNGFDHIVTYERALSNKVMPSTNSPSNKKGVAKGTMTQEFVIISQKQ